MIRCLLAFLLAVASALGLRCSTEPEPAAQLEPSTTTAPSTTPIEHPFLYAIPGEPCSGEGATWLALVQGVDVPVACQSDAVTGGQPRWQLPPDFVIG